MLEQLIEFLHRITKLDLDTIAFGLFCIPFSAVISLPPAYLLDYNPVIVWAIGYVNAMGIYKYIMYKAAQLEDDDDYSSGS